SVAGSRKQLFPLSKAGLNSGDAIKFPKPLPDRKSWLGNNRSKLDPLSNLENAPDSSRMAIKSFLLLTAGYGLSKKTQTWPPFPERERSRYAGMALAAQASRNFWASTCQSALSKSATKNQEVLS